MTRPKKYLYIYTITTEGGIVGIERLRAALAKGPPARVKAFNRPNDDKTFFAHYESDISELLKEHDFPFSVERKEIGEEMYLK